MVNSILKIAALATLSLGLSAFASAAEKHDPFPEVQLSKHEYRGAEAIQAIAPHITKISKHYKVKEEELKRAFKNDSTLRVNSNGLLFFAEDITLGEGAVFNPSPDTLPDAETFKLHSRSNATGGTIYLSFEGTTVSGTSWNFNGPIVAAPYSQDADPTFNASELREIRAIWLRISEDYAAFNLDVTTERPLGPPTAKYTEVIFTPSSAWYGNGAGGVAFVGSYTWGDGTPCWVFSSLLNNNTKYVAEAGSHEAGHTLGLYHWAKYDPATGTKLTEYYSGQGNWAPIMGVGYYRGIVTWSKGEYSGAGTAYGMGNAQDDMQVISSKTGYASDEAPSTLNSTTRMARITDANGMQIRHRGIISSSTDKDVYRMDTLGGAIHLTVDPQVVSPNLDFQLRLYGANGSVIQESDPFEVASSSIDLTSSDPGTYYFEVSPVGSGDPLTTGYTSYGSNGQYHVSGTYAAAANDTGPAPQPTSTPQPTPTVTPTPSPTPLPTPTPVPNAAPTAAIVAPVVDAQVKRTKNFTITVRATDDVTVKKIVIKMGSTIVCTKNANAVDVTVSCMQKAPSQTGPISLTATATDNQGVQTTSQAVQIQVIP